VGSSKGTLRNLDCYVYWKTLLRQIHGLSKEVPMKYLNLYLKKTLYLYIQMKSIRLISPWFAMLLVLFASSQFMVGMHFCQGAMQGIALFKEAPACEHKAQLPPCHAQASPENSGGCCDDEVLVHESEGFTFSTTQIHVEVPFTLLELDYPLLTLLPEEKSLQTFSNLNEHPPNGLKPDIIIFVQSFLI